MTTVSQDAPQLAAAAIDAAIVLIGGGDPAETILVPRLIHRSTTGPVA